MGKRWIEKRRTLRFDMDLLYLYDKEKRPQWGREIRRRIIEEGEAQGFTDIVVHHLHYERRSDMVCGFVVRADVGMMIFQHRTARMKRAKR